MLRPEFFVNTLMKHGIEFYAGVPDSLLKNLCAYITDNLSPARHIITANEGGAIGIAAGYHLATGLIPVVYMQNSGEGNIINPLASLTDREVYNIPILLVIGWRGRPGEHDEPQHVKQGKVTIGLLNVMGVNYSILPKDEGTASKVIGNAVDYMKSTGESYAIVVEKNTFDAYDVHDIKENNLTLSREQAIQTVVARIEDNACIVSSTGMISRELFEVRTSSNHGHERDFLTVGSMGHASQIALGVSIEKPNRRVYCFDGDGAVIMHMGNMAIIGDMSPRNFVHVVFNNGAHDSVGGQPTVGLKIDLCAIAKAVGYQAAFSTDSLDSLSEVLDTIKSIDGPIFLQICVKKGNRCNLGRPSISPVQNKEAFMNYIQ